MNLDNYINVYIVFSDVPLSIALRALNTNSVRTVCIIDRCFNLVGTITDGDIRKAFLNGCNLDDPCGEYANTDCYFEKIGNKASLESPIVTNFRLVPLVENGKVVSLKLNHPRVKNVSTALVMAGGFGRRMGELTRSVPKPMLMIKNKPILELIITSLKSQSIDKIFISIHYLSDKIKEYFKDGREYGVDIEYLEEERPLGTGGCLSLIKDPCNLVILNGDVLSNLNYQNFVGFCSERNSVAGLVIRNYALQHPFGLVKTNGFNLLGFEEKPLYRSSINAGIYYISKSIFDLIPQGKFDMPDLLTRIKETGGKVVVYPYEDDFWIDIGNPLALQDAENILGGH